MAADFKDLKMHEIKVFINEKIQILLLENYFSVIKDN